MRTLQRFMLVLAIAASAGAIAPAMAGSVQVATEIYVGDTEQGTLAELGAPGDETIIAESGTVLRYEIHYTSREDEPTEVIITNEVPSTMRFLTGYGDNGLARVEVSVDGGKTFGLLSTLRVLTPTSLRPATLDDVTTIRWFPIDRVRPGQKGRLYLLGMVR